MARSRTNIPTAPFLGIACLGIIGVVLAPTVAAKAGQQAHRHGHHPRVVIQALQNPDRFTYRLNPYTGYGWSFPGVTVGFGDWGSQPSHYPYARVWSHSGVASDLACNMPSSPCWNQDRE
jgi:hypothetical protein